MKFFLVSLLVMGSLSAFANNCEQTVTESALNQHKKNGGQDVYEKSVSLHENSGDTLIYIVELSSAIGYGEDQGADFFFDRYYITATGTKKNCSVSKIKHTLSWTL